jgi:hypothetical protein
MAKEVIDKAKFKDKEVRKVLSLCVKVFAVE